MNTDYILLVDDDEEVLGTLTRALTRQGYVVQVAMSGPEGLQFIAEQMPQLLILDIMMPHMDGIEVCQRLRADPFYNRLPILFLSARDATEEVIEGLDAGADDYIAKPFEISELNARVRALLRRAQRDPNSEMALLHIGDLMLNSANHQVEVNGQPIQLTLTEHRLLRYLMEHPNQALSAGHLLQAVWAYPPDVGDQDLVRAHIRNLRFKLEPGSKEPRYIRTVHGVGYMIYNPALD
jgi:DNA-binding response OmpR family regulator